MPRLVPTPTIVPAAGTPPKIIAEHIGRVNSQTSDLSIARMTSPQGWVEPGQRPDFDEYTLVLEGCLRVEFEGGVVDVTPGQTIVTTHGEWVRYSTPHPGGAQYVAICVPAFAPDTVHRDA